MKSVIKTGIKIFAVLAFAAGIGAYFYFTPVELAEEDKQDLLKTGTYAEGLKAWGEDIGGMTYGQALAVMQEKEEEYKKGVSFTLKSGDSSIVIGPDELDIRFDTVNVLKDALTIAKEGNYRQRRQALSDAGNTDLDIKCTVDSKSAAQKAAAAARSLETECLNASLEFLPKENSFSYTPEVYGTRVNEDELSRLVISAAGIPDFSPIEIPFIKTSPEITEQMLRDKTVKRSSFSTSFAKSPYNDKNRVYNIKKCVEIINSSDKTTLAPGDELSLNEVLGPRTSAGGWKDAPGYVSGRTEDQPGGGVCQISTTLYCAWLTADLEVTDRINHSIPVGYSKKGLDATISTGGPDLKIRNDTNSNVYLCASLTDDERVIFDVYGEPFDGFTEVTLSSVKIKDIAPDGEMKITVDENYPSDYEKVTVKRRTGSLWRTYKIYKNGDDELRKQETFTSAYRAYAGEKTVGTA